VICDANEEREEPVPIFGKEDAQAAVMQYKTLTLRRLMSYIYGAPILDVSRSHMMTQHSR